MRDQRGEDCRYPIRMSLADLLKLADGISSGVAKVHYLNGGECIDFNNGVSVVNDLVRSPVMDD